MRLEIRDDEGTLLGSVDWDGKEFVYKGYAAIAKRDGWKYYNWALQKFVTEEDGSDYLRGMLYSWATPYAYATIVDGQVPAKTLLRTEQWEALLSFMGYGNAAGDFWFVGIEEAGDADPEKNLRQNIIKSGFRAIEDLAEAHAVDKFDWDMTKLIPTWATMSRIVMRLRGEHEDDWFERERAREYQATRLGRANGETFLADLLPLRKVSDDNWPNWQPFNRWVSWDDYFAEIGSRRLGLLRDLWSKHRPTYTVCYGKWYWKYYREIFDASFSDVLDARAQIARSGDSTIALTPFFSSRAGVTRSFIDQLAHQISR
jgi:hypothetical protein